MPFRLWTRGYDVYSPNKIIVVHDYHNAMSPDKELVNPLEWLKNGIVSVCMNVSRYECLSCIYSNSGI